MGLGGGKMTRATGTSMKTTKPIKAQLGSGKTGMTGASGCLSKAGHGTMPAQGLPAKGRDRSPSPRRIPTSWRGTRHGDRQGVRLRENPYPMPGIAEEEDEDDDLGLGLNSQPSNMPASGLPAEGIAPEQIDQMLGMLGDLFGSRNSRYDNRGYRSQIRRQLRYKLKQWNIPQPAWLDDYGAKINVNEFRNRAFAWMKAIKEGSRVPPPVPEQGLPEAGRSNEVKQLYRQMTRKKATKPNMWPYFYWAKIPMKDPKTNQKKDMWHCFLLPHEWLASLWQDPAAQSACMPRQGSKLEHALHQLCPCLGLPVEDIIPFGLHGDAVPVLGTIRKASLEFITVNLPAFHWKERVPSIQMDFWTRHKG